MQKARQSNLDGPETLLRESKLLLIEPGPCKSLWKKII